MMLKKNLNQRKNQQLELRKVHHLPKVLKRYLNHKKEHQSPQSLRRLLQELKNQLLLAPRNQLHLLRNLLKQPNLLQLLKNLNQELNLHLLLLHLLRKNESFKILIFMCWFFNKCFRSLSVVFIKKDYLTYIHIYIYYSEIFLGINIIVWRIGQLKVC